MVANPMHRLQDATPELLKCHNLNGCGGCRSPLGVVSKPDGATLGATPRHGTQSRQLDTGLQVFPFVVVVRVGMAGAQRPEDGTVSSSVVVPRSCGYGPQQAKVVGAMGNLHPISNQYGHCIWPSGVFPSPVARAGLMGAGDSGCPGLQGPGQPGGPGEQAQACQATPSVPPLPWSKDNRCEWLSLSPLPCHTARTMD